MTLNLSVLETYLTPATLEAHLRVTPMAHAATPLGMGFGKTRLACPKDSFKVLYVAPDLITGVAETIVRDRFVDRVRRRLTQEEIELWGVTEVESHEPLNLLDLRHLAPHLLNVPTDALLAKNQAAGRRMSRKIYHQAPMVDGVIYISRHTKRDCVAVYDRGVAKLRAGAVHPITAVRALVPALESLQVQVIRTDGSTD